MKITPKRRNYHRGVIGVESAIVMIAFVIVAASLAFVVLNMGFSTTQQAKTAISTSLEESSNAIEIVGKVTGSGMVANADLEVISIPLKIASGGGSVNLDDTSTAIKYLSKTVTYDNIFASGCALSSATYTDLSAALDAAVTASCISVNPMLGVTDPTATKAVLYWTISKGTQNEVLDQNEHAVLALVFKDTEQPAELDDLSVEIISPTGAVLTVERTVPFVARTVVDMG